MNEKDNNNIWLYIIGIISVIAIVYSWYYTYEKLIVLSNEERGTIGDMFGSINALYSGLAFAGIIFTILLQRKELSFQRQELKQTRKEFEIQNETLKLQRFENTFFNLLTLHHQIVDSIDLDIEKEKKTTNNSVKHVLDSMNTPQEYDRIIIKGRDVFKHRYEDLKLHLEFQGGIFNEKYLEIYEYVQTDFGHYFRNLYRIIKLVDETEFITYSQLKTSQNSATEEQKTKYKNKNQKLRYKYTSMVRSQLSDYELLWLFYNCISTNGIEKFKPYIEKYSLLKNIPKDKLHDKTIMNEYNNSAFENNNCA